MATLATMVMARAWRWGSRRAMWGAACRSVSTTAAAAAAGEEGAASLVRYNFDEHYVATITLNSPSNRNALSTAMLTALRDAVSRAAVHDGARVVVLQAAGSAFSAGHDLKELAVHQRTRNEAAARAIFAMCSELMVAIATLPVPVIAAVHGIAAAAGCQLAASADIVLSTRTAKFGTPGINVGLFCTTPGVALTRSVHAKKAAEMLFTGELQPAEDMVQAGLVNRVVDGGAAEVQEAAAAMARIIASKPATVIRLGKKAIAAQANQPLRDAYTVASAAMCQNLVREADAHEGIDAFIGKRPPRFNAALTLE